MCMFLSLWETEVINKRHPDHGSLTKDPSRRNMEATPLSFMGASRRCQQRRRNRLAGCGSRWNLESKVPYSQPSPSSERSCCGEEHGGLRVVLLFQFASAPCLYPS